MAELIPFKSAASEEDEKVETVAERVAEKVLSNIGDMVTQFPSMTGCVVFAWNDSGDFAAAWDNSSCIPSFCLPDFVRGALTTQMTINHVNGDGE